MRKLVMGGALGMFLLSVVLVACGGSGGDVADPEARRFQDMWEIDKIEKDFHGAMSEKNVGQMMALFAPNATMTVGPGRPRRGWRDPDVLAGEVGDVRRRERMDLGSPRVQARDHGRRRPRDAALRVPFVNAETGKVVSVTAADLDVARIDGSWLITNMIGGTAVLEV